MKLLYGKCVIVTGASSGIGRAAAQLFAGSGARLVLVARGAGRLVEVTDEIVAAGGEAVSCAGDAAHAETHERSVAMAREHFGGLMERSTISEWSAICGPWRTDRWRTGRR